MQRDRDRGEPGRGTRRVRDAARGSRDGPGRSGRTRREPADRRARRAAAGRPARTTSRRARFATDRRLGRHRTVGEHRPPERRARRRASRRPPRRRPRRPRRRTADAATNLARRAVIRSSSHARRDRPASAIPVGATARRSGYNGRRPDRRVGPWPSAEPDLPSPGARPRAAAPTEFEDRRCRAAPGARPLVRTIVDRARRRSSSSCSAASGRPERAGRSARASSRRTRRRPRARRSTISTTIVFVIAAAIFFVVEGLIVWTVIRYRRKPGDDELPPQTHGHNLAEVIWTVVPTIIVIFLFFISWQTLNTVEARSNAARPHGPGRRRPVPVDVRLPPRRAPRRPPSRCSRCRRRSGPTAACTCRPARRPTST